MAVLGIRRAGRRKQSCNNSQWGRSFVTRTVAIKRILCAGAAASSPEWGGRCAWPGEEGIARPSVGKEVLGRHQLLGSYCYST